MNKIVKIKIAVVGLNFGEWAIENELLHGTGSVYMQMIAVCDVNKEKSDIFAKRYHVKGYHNLDDLLMDNDVEAVVLITGPYGRARLIHKILDAQKPVMTTKPFDTSSEETLSVLTRAEKISIPVFMNSPSPIAAGALKKIEEWIDKYNLGRIIGYRANTWCSYREEADGSWYDDPKLCPAAPIYRLGIYLLNDLCRFLTPADKVQVLESRIFTKRPTADNAQLSILHEDGTIGSIYASFCIDDLQYYRCSFELNFEKGAIYKNIGPKESEETALSLSANVDGKLVNEQYMVENEGAGYQWEVFYRAVKGETVEVTVSPEHVSSVIKILEIMKEKI